MADATTRPEPKPPPAALFTVANPVMTALLRSPPHRVLSGG